MSIYEDIIDTSLSKYDNPGLTKTDVLSVITTFGDLRPKLDTFVFNDGFRKKLLQLDGTVPVIYKNAVYNIPVAIWLLQKHPYNPPIVYVRPTATMQINSGRHVDIDGKIDLPCLRDWKYPESDLLGTIQILTIVFGEEPPVYSKLKQAQGIKETNGSRDYTERTGSVFTEEVIKSNGEERDSDVKCDTCHRAENVFVCAEGYCVDCKEFFCKECLRHHSRLTATKNHRIFAHEM